MTLETSLLVRWLPWVAVLHLLALAVLWRSLGRPAARAAIPAVIAVSAAALLTAGIAVRHDPTLRLSQAIGYMATVSLGSAGLLAFLWSRSGAISARRCAVLLGVVMLGFYLAVLPYVRTVQPTASDEPHYLIITQSLVLDGDLDLANDYAGDRYLQFYPDRLPDIHGIVVGSHIYSIRDLGLPLISVPAFAAAGRTGVLALVCAVGAYLVGMLFLLMRALDLSPRTAVLAAGAAGLLHPIATYTTQISPELFAAALFATALYALRRGARSSARALALASGCMGLIGIFSTRAWLVAFGVGLCIAYWAIRPDGSLPLRARLTRVAAAALPFAVLLLATSAGNCLMFQLSDGSGRCYFMPSAGYFQLRDQQPVLAYAPQVGLSGLLFDRTFGLLSHTPLYFLAFVGAPSLVAALRRRRAPLLLPLAIGSVTLVLYIASIAYWWADGAPPSRYLVVVMPLCVIALGYGLERLRELRWGWLIALVPLVLSAIVSFIFLITPNVRYDLAPSIAASGSPGQVWEEFAGWFRGDPGLAFPSIPRADDAGFMLSLFWWAIAAAFVAAGARAPFVRPGPAVPAPAEPP